MFCDSFLHNNNTNQKKKILAGLWGTKGVVRTVNASAVYNIQTTHWQFAFTQTENFIFEGDRKLLGQVSNDIKEFF
jgi:hypothetical protein